MQSCTSGFESGSGYDFASFLLAARRSTPSAQALTVCSDAAAAASSAARSSSVARTCTTCVFRSLGSFGGLPMPQPTPPPGPGSKSSQVQFHTTKIGAGPVSWSRAEVGALVVAPDQSVWECVRKLSKPHGQPELATPIDELVRHLARLLAIEYLRRMQDAQQQEEEEKNK